MFSHDDRLADAVRRLPDHATILEVQRRDRSQVRVKLSVDPVRRYLSDATAVLRVDQLPDELRQEIVANCCRGALDAAAITKVRALAIFDEPNRASDLYSRLNRGHGPRRLMS